MITKFNQFSGLFSVTIDDRKLALRLKYDENIIPIQIKIVLDNDDYDELSIIVPDSDELDRKEFFLNPKIDETIIKTLVDENFIQETDNETVAGEFKTKSYILV